MRLPGFLYEWLERWQRLGTTVLGVRAAIAAGALLLWLAAGLVGEFKTPLTLVLVLAVIGAVVAPDSGFPLVLIAVMVLVWLAEVRPMSVAWSPVLGVAVLLVHVASSRAAAIPDGARLDRPGTTRLLTDCGWSLLAMVGVWLVVLALRTLDLSGQIIVSTAALLVAGGFAAVVSSRLRPGN